MSTNEIQDFDKNIKEIKELGKKLEEPLDEPYTTLYHDKENKVIKFKGQYIDNKYEGRGIILDNKGNMEFNGYFSNNEYDGFGNKYNNVSHKLEYEGYFKNGKKNGKGILYYNNSERIYFNGIFDMDNYNEGILYDPEGNIIYEGIFINNRPKEGKNLKLFDINKFLIYQGDLLNGQFCGFSTLYEIGKYEKNEELKYLKYIGEFKNDKFDGHGKFYLDHYLGKYLFYEGNFINNNFSGKGKIYYQNKKIYYDGQFENNLMNGEGIIYYINGNIKIKGIFSNNNCESGIYYNPEGKKLYKGAFKNGIPKESKKVITIYYNNTNKIYEGEIHDGKYEGKGIEYCPILNERILYEGNFENNLYELSYVNYEGIKDKIMLNCTKIFLFSNGDTPGTTCLFNRLLGLEFPKKTLETIGIDKGQITYKSKIKEHKLTIWDTGGNKRFRRISLKQAKYCFLGLYMFDLNGSNEINLDCIKEVKEINNKIKIYMVGNKLDLINKYEKINKDYLEKNKNIIINAIKSNLVDKYFEISAKTGEGIDKLVNSIKCDSLKYLENVNKPDKNIIIKPKLKDEKKCIIY